MGGTRGIDVLPATSADELLRLTESLRAREPVMTNVLGSVATGVAGGRTYDECFWWVLRDETGEVVGCAIRTAPYKLLLSPMPHAAAKALGAAVAVGDPAL